jgi:hypothetical protein
VRKETISEPPAAVGPVTSDGIDAVINAILGAGSGVVGDLLGQLQNPVTVLGTLNGLFTPGGLHFTTMQSIPPATLSGFFTGLGVNSAFGSWQSAMGGLLK